MTETNFDKRFSADVFRVDAADMESLRSRCRAIAAEPAEPSAAFSRRLRVGLACAVPAMAAVIAVAAALLSGSATGSSGGGDTISDMIAALSDDQLRLIGSATYDDIIFNEQL